MSRRFWAELWTRPGHANFRRLIPDLSFETFGVHAGLNQVGDGNGSLPDTFDTRQLVDSVTPASSLVRLYSEDDPTEPLHEWIPGQVVPKADKDDPNVEVVGVGINGIPAYARVEAFDWDGSDNFVSLDPDWIYGGENTITNGSLEDHPFGIANLGFEDGTREPWWPGATEGVDATAVITTVDVDTGTYALAVTPLQAEGGASTGLNLFGANFYTVTARVKGAAGVDYQIGASGGAQMHAVSGNSVLVEGSFQGGWEVQHYFTGTGNYETVILVFGTAGDQTSSQLSIREGEAVLDGSTFFVDDVTISGFGIGTAPWEPTGLQTPGVVGPVPVFQVSNVQASVGTWSLFVTADPGNGAFQRIANVLPGVTYTMTVDVGFADVASPWALEARDVQDNLLGSATAVIGTGAFTTLEVEFTTPTFLPGARNEIFLRVVNADSVQRSVFIDNLVFFRGRPAATIGQILTELYDDATTDHPGRIVWEDAANPGTSYLTLDFDATLDSNGVAWPGPVEIKLPMRYSYSQVMAELASQFDVEYRIVPDNPEAGTWLWQVYNPGGMGSVVTASALIGGTTNTRRQLLDVNRSATDLMVEGIGRVTSRVRDGVALAALGRIEMSALDRESLDPDDSAAAGLAEINTGARSFQYTFADPLTPPLVGYNPGDTIGLDDPPEVVDESVRVTDIVGAFSVDSDEWTVQLGSTAVLNPDAAVANAVGQLKLADPVHRPQGSFAYSPEFLGDTTSEQVDVEFGSTPVGAHIHLLGSVQAIPVDGADLTWANYDPVHPARNFPPVSFPSQSFLIQEAGYYDIEPAGEWDDWYQGGAVTITRTRDVTPVVVWPPQSSTLGSARSGHAFRNVAKGVECLPGDVITVYVDHGDSVSHDLGWATVSCELIDRTRIVPVPPVPELLIWTEDDTHDFGAGTLLAAVYVIAGGGAGGTGTSNPSYRGGGGGAGGVRILTNYNAVGVVTIVVGDGGTGLTSGQGNPGANSSFDGQTATGGGGGGGNSATAGGAGGSGGGGAGFSSPGSGGGGTAGQGMAGGAGMGTISRRGGGGGGGFSGAGTTPPTSVNNGGTGGDGIDLTAIVGTAWGENGWFAGGGGGSLRANPQPLGYGGLGGGGNGQHISNGQAAEAGQVNTGGGGGGGEAIGAGHGNGGSGIVIAVPA